MNSCDVSQEHFKVTLFMFLQELKGFPVNKNI